MQKVPDKAWSQTNTLKAGTDSDMFPLYIMWLLLQLSKLKKINDKSLKICNAC